MNEDKDKTRESGENLEALDQLNASFGRLQDVLAQREAELVRREELLNQREADLDRREAELSQCQADLVRQLEELSESFGSQVSNVIASLKRGPDIQDVDNREIPGNGVVDEEVAPPEPSPSPEKGDDQGGDVEKVRLLLTPENIVTAWKQAAYADPKTFTVPEDISEGEGGYWNRFCEELGIDMAAGDSGKYISFMNGSDYAILLNEDDDRDEFPFFLVFHPTNSILTAAPFRDLFICPEKDLTGAERSNYYDLTKPCKIDQYAAGGSSGIGSMTPEQFTNLPGVRVQEFFRINKGIVVHIRNSRSHKNWGEGVAEGLLEK